MGTVGPDGARAERVVFVTVGTDHHPFQRLVDWADQLAASEPSVRVVVQYGTARPPQSATGYPSLPKAELEAWLSRADVVVTQGGPGGIVESRGRGVLPIVVARDPAHGEHVDGHQMRFAEHMRRQNKIALATDRREFERLVRRALAESADFRVAEVSSPTADTASVINARLTRLASRSGG